VQALKFRLEATGSGAPHPSAKGAPLEVIGSGEEREAFVHAVCEEADCGLLLDVNNVVVNAKNRKRDARADLFALPLHRTLQMHVAGHETHHGRCLDSHGAPVSEQVTLLAAEALAHIGRPLPVLLERDLDIPPLTDVLDEADQLRARLMAVA
jgi:uncharacterized protein (UPF0276 family)